MSSCPRFSNKHSIVVRIAALLTLALCTLGLLGWLADFQFLRSPIAGFSPIRPVTALMFIVVSLAILGQTEMPSSSVARGNLRMVGVLATILGGYVLVAYALGKATFLDQLLIPHAHLIAEAAGNRMPPQTALNFALLGVALFLLDRTGLAGRIAGLATLGVLAVTYAVFLGMLFHSTEIYALSNQNTMAITAAFSFVLIATALLSMNAECRLFELFARKDLGGQAARRLLPVIIIVPTLIGWLRVIGQDLGLYETAFGTAMSMFIVVLLMFAIVVGYSFKVSAADQERKAIEQELVRNEQKYRELFDYNQGMICIHDVDGTITAANPAVFTSTGYSANDMIGSNITSFVPTESQHSMAGFFGQIEHDGLSSGLLPIVAKDGRRLTWRYQSILVTEEGREPYVIGHAIDVTELISAQQQLREMSLTDEMTGLLNRRGFLTLAEQQLRLERHSGTARGLTLMFADMDGLKIINDTLGHEAGSDALKTLARVIKSVVRSGDLVARWGGDEFVILSIGAADENVELMTDRIQKGLEAYNASSGKPYKVACSIGVAPINREGERSFEEIIAEADGAMYAEKRRRKAELGIAPKQLAGNEGELMPDSLAWY